MSDDSQLFERALMRRSIKGKRREGADARARTESETIMRQYRIHIDRFDSADHLRGKQRTYEAVKAAVLEAGRYSVFEATQTAANARLFTRLDNDPEIETDRVSIGYPWIGVRRRAEAK